MDNAAPKWLNRYPMIDPDHVHDLDTRAAINEFHKKMPRHQAEEAAYDKYRRDQVVEAASHHYAGMSAAHAAGDMDSARKHGTMYELACKAMGHGNPLEPPPEVLARVKNMPPSVYRFKAHKADLFSLPPDDPGKTT